MTHTNLAIGPGAGLARPDIERIDLDDGSFILRSRVAPRPHARCLGDWLEHWARVTPDAVFLGERDAQGNWRRLTYAEVRWQIGRIGQALLDRGMSAQAPIAVLSDNSIDVALLMLAAMHVGVPVAVLSPAYTRATSDHGKLHALLKLLEPSLMYAGDGDVYGPAMRSSGIDCPMVFSTHVPSGGVALSLLAEVDETPAVRRAFEQITPDTHAKYLLTSGSTGSPKAVVNTHRMLCANQEAMVQVWPFLEYRPPVLLDWLPWSHTFGANHNFNLILRNGGALYIDDGRPVPGLFERSLVNLGEVLPTLYFNVPKGYDALLPALEQNQDLAARFLAGLDAMFFAAAALPQQLSDRLAQVMAPHRSTPVFFTSAWGATETSPTVTNVHFVAGQSANLGVPVPGVELKFVPNGNKLEMRVRGPNVFTHYRGAPELTASAFDADGFYLIGDAGRLADPNNPNAGVLFDGRVSEDFKLTTGTWVSVGMLRIAAVGALSPLAQDVVVAGHGRDEVGLLIFPSPALRRLGDDADGKLDGAELAAVPAVRQAIATALAQLGQGKGSAARAARAVILSRAPDLGQGESTDKGYINQRRVLELRAAEVERLFSTDASVIFSA
ncbi:MAG: feruloyl-CoA synthase [Duganella sp.]